MNPPIDLSIVLERLWSSHLTMIAWTSWRLSLQPMGHKKQKVGHNGGKDDEFQIIHGHVVSFFFCNYKGRSEVPIGCQLVCDPTAYILTTFRFLDHPVHTGLLISSLSSQTPLQVRIASWHSLSCCFSWVTLWSPIQQLCFTLTKYLL